MSNINLIISLTVQPRSSIYCVWSYCVKSLEGILCKFVEATVRHKWREKFQKQNQLPCKREKCGFKHGVILVANIEGIRSIQD